MVRSRSSHHHAGRSVAARCAVQLARLNASGSKRWRRAGEGDREDHRLQGATTIPPAACGPFLGTTSSVVSSLLKPRRALCNHPWTHPVARRSRYQRLHQSGSHSRRFWTTMRQSKEVPSPPQAAGRWFWQPTADRCSCRGIDNLALPDACSDRDAVASMEDAVHLRQDRSPYLYRLLPRSASSRAQPSLPQVVTLAYLAPCRGDGAHSTECVGIRVRENHRQRVARQQVDPLVHRGDGCDSVGLRHPGKVLGTCKVVARADGRPDDAFATSLLHLPLPTLALADTY